MIDATRLLADEAAPGRDCGDCSICCVLPEIAELGKPARVVCRNLSEGRCSCYDRRPAACRAFNCLWLRGAVESDDPRYRPGTLGVLLDAYVLRPSGERRVVATEIWSGALDEPPVRELLAALAETGEVTVYYRDGRCSTLRADGAV